MHRCNFSPRCTEPCGLSFMGFSVSRFQAHVSGNANAILFGGDAMRSIKRNGNPMATGLVVPTLSSRQSTVDSGRILFVTGVTACFCFSRSSCKRHLSASERTKSKAEGLAAVGRALQIAAWPRSGCACRMHETASGHKPPLALLVHWTFGRRLHPRTMPSATRTVLANRRSLAAAASDQLDHFCQLLTLAAGIRLTASIGS
jgi:hypothetical protein